MPNSMPLLSSTIFSSPVTPDKEGLSSFLHVQSSMWIDSSTSNCMWVVCNVLNDLHFCFFAKHWTHVSLFGIRDIDNTESSVYAWRSIVYSILRGSQTASAMFVLGSPRQVWSFGMFWVLCNIHFLFPVVVPSTVLHKFLFHRLLSSLIFFQRVFQVLQCA